MNKLYEEKGEEKRTKEMEKGIQIFIQAERNKKEEKKLKKKRIK